MASRPTAGRLGHVLADRQSVVQAEGQPGAAQRQVAGKISVLMHRYMRPQENISQPEKFLTWKKFTYSNGTSSVQTKYSYMIYYNQQIVKK